MPSDYEIPRVAVHGRVRLFISTAIAVAGIILSVVAIDGSWPIQSTPRPAKLYRRLLEFVGVAERSYLFGGISTIAYVVWILSTAATLLFIWGARRLELDQVRDARIALALFLMLLSWITPLAICWLYCVIDMAQMRP